MSLALKEARETNYWLRLYQSTELVSEVKLTDLLQESHEIIAILTTIVKYPKNQVPKKPKNDKAALNNKQLSTVN